MEFHIFTGPKASNKSFNNNEDINNLGQGMLQGSSSAAPVYNINSDFNLSTYCHLAHGGSFIHPITNQTHTDHATQYVHDMSVLLNIMQENGRSNAITELFHRTNEDTALWRQLLWISGGLLNASKCFYYYIDPKFDHSSQNIRYGINTSGKHITFQSNGSGQEHIMDHLSPTMARRTLCVMLAPNGSAASQIQTCKWKLETFLAKTSHWAYLTL